MSGDEVRDLLDSYSLACGGCGLVGRDCSCADVSECPDCNLEDCECGPDDVLATDH